MRHQLSALLAMLAAGTLFAHASTIPYPNSGTAISTSAVIKATATGDVTGYFVQGGASSNGGAGDDDVIYMYDVTSGTTSGPFFDNQTTASGASTPFGAVTAGDTLVFELYNLSIEASNAANPTLPPAPYIFATDSSFSQDNTVHGYVTPFGGGTVNGDGGTPVTDGSGNAILFPAGVYVGMEDLPASESDFNYTDDVFVFTNVNSTVSQIGATPEPSSLILLGSGVLGLAGAVLRRVRK